MQTTSYTFYFVSYRYALDCRISPHKMLEPKVVARLAQGLKLTKIDTVLEIGTGSGYATALLAKLAGKVVSDDLDAEQQNHAKAVLDSLALNNIDYVQNNELTEPSAGAPFDAVYVGGAVDRVPEVLKEQLKDGGCMAVIVGRHYEIGRASCRERV